MTINDAFLYEERAGHSTLRLPQLTRSRLSSPNDPGRTVLEILLTFLVILTLLRSRT